MPGFMTRSAAAAVLLAGLSLTLAGATHAKTNASGSCAAAGGTSSVRRPQFVRNIPTGETGWFASPSLVDLNGDGKLEIVAPFYSTFVFDAKGHLLGKGTATKGRVYAPGVVADLDGDKIPDIVVGGNEGTVAAYDFVGAASCASSAAGRRRRAAAASARRFAAWQRPTSTATAASRSSSRRPTRHRPGRRCSSSSANGTLWHPKGAPATSWPRYNRLTGAGNDAAFNGVGNHGYGAYGENVAIGNLDDDPQLEIVVTFDNHQINVFNDDGTSVLAAPWFTNRESGYAGRRLGWGQFIRWLDPTVENDQYHLPRRAVARRAQDALAAVDRVAAGRGRPRRRRQERGDRPPQRRARRAVRHAGVRVHGARRRRSNGGVRSAMRHVGFVRPPLSAKPVFRPDGDWYPPSGIPAPTVVEHLG